MNEEKRMILEMLSAGKLTEEQAAELLEALGDTGEEAASPPEESELERIGEQAEAAAQQAVEEARAEKEESAGPIPPAPPAPPAPPRPADGSPEDMERYVREAQENNERYCREMNEYQQEMARYTAQCQAEMARYAAQVQELRDHAAGSAAPRPQAPTSGDWTGWLSGIGKEIRRGLKEIGQELGRDLDGAMDDVTEAIDDMKEALGDVVEEWQEELMEEQEELMEEAAEAAGENCFPDFDPGFPFNGPGGMEPVPMSPERPEFIDGEFVYRKQAVLSNLEELDINWPTGQVSIAPWDGDTVDIVEYSKKALAPEHSSALFVRDSGLTILEYPQNSTGGIFSAGWNAVTRPSKRLEVLIPRKQCQNIEKLRVQCMSGTVRVMELSGDSFTISTVSGTVVLRSISAETLDAGTVSGTLTLEDCSAEKLRAHSVSGTNLCKGFSAEKAELTTVSGSLNAHGNAEKFKVSTVSGSASLMVDQCPEKANMHSVSGSLKIRLPEYAGFTADYSSSSGGFKCEFPAQITPDRKHQKRGQAVFGNGECKIELHTTSGSMSILKADGISQ
ncbi:DUF4097 family beta strand repeat-containing protein [Acutalibacter sp. 1XD8-36]|uniref:DUF4097 family beta strand repeat-containing protein n=1 Tax=Acutalibacter sp. 1XD8-36 TaxID=2320852 RepID=UPI002624AFBC|nr:DUF4097 family beta strand repeat-containing protein [Acutalibacter sp. 1XD8-36]